MKSIKKLFKAIFIVIIVSCSSNDENAYNKEYNLYGQIRTVKIVRYLINGNNTTENKQYIGKAEYVFNKKGRIFHKIFDDNRGFEQKEFIYNSKGLLLEENTTDQMYKTKVKDKYEYNKSGKLVRKISYGVNGGKIGSMSYDYENDKLIKEVDYTFSDSVFEYYVYKYDDYSNIVEKNTYDAIDSLKSTTTYQYDSLGNEIETIANGKNGGYQNIWQREFEKRNKILELQLNEKGNIISKNNYEYLKFDNYNNWIELKITNDRGNIILINREIRYF